MGRPGLESLTWLIAANRSEEKAACGTSSWTWKPTCWENLRDYDRMEIIEIGAVELPAADTPPSREFNQFIRPVAENQLSDFCQQLTTIRQSDIDRTDDFRVVFPQFLSWIGEDPFILCSWGRMT